MNKLRNYWEKGNWVFVFSAAALLALAVFRLSAPFRGHWEIEEYTVREATALAGGLHRWGIVDYMHMRNGPVYLIAPFIEMGHQTISFLRWIPQIFLALASAFFLVTLLKRSRMGLEAVWSILLTVGLIFQPGIRQWAGFLSWMSYDIFVPLFVMVFCLGRARRNNLLMMLLGFVVSWFGYNNLTSSFFLVFGIRFMDTHHRENQTAPESFRQAGLAAMWFCSGGAMGMASHILQNILALGSVNRGIISLMEGASARAGLSQFDFFYPNQVRVWTVGERIALIPKTLVWFFKRGPTLQFLAFYPIVIGMILLGVWVLWKKETLFLKEEFYGSQKAPSKLASIIVSSAMVFLVSAGWILVFPHSTEFHPLWVSRFSFLSFAFAGAAVLLWGRTQTGDLPPHPAISNKAFFRKAVLLALPSLVYIGSWAWYKSMISF